MNRYPLNGENLSPFCWGSWDDENKKFLDTNSIDIMQCCMDSCKGQVSFCFDTCRKTYGPIGKNPNYSENGNCNQKCSEIISDCESGCAEVNSEGLKIISKCAKDSGCGNYPIFSPNCLRDKKDSIIECCKKSCITNQSTDCDHDFCDDFYNHLYTGVQSPLERIKNAYNLNREVFVNEKHNNPVYTFYIIFVILAIVGLYIIHKLKN